MACFLLDFGIISSSIIETNCIVATQLLLNTNYEMNKLIPTQKSLTFSKQQMSFKRLKYYTRYLFLKFTKYIIISQ